MNVVHWQCNILSDIVMTFQICISLFITVLCFLSLIPSFNPYKNTIDSFISKPAYYITIIGYKKVTIKVRHKVREGGGTALHIINLSTMWRQVISFSFRPLYPWETSPLCPLGRSPDGPQNWCRLFGGKRTVLPLLGNKPRFPDHPAYSLVYWQSCLGSYMKIVWPHFMQVWNSAI
jgi:hypothetical protein